MFRKSFSLSKEELLEYANCIRNLTALCYESFNVSTDKTKDTLTRVVGYLNIESQVEEKFGRNIPDNLTSAYSKTKYNIQLGYKFIEKDMQETFVVTSLFLSIFRDVNKLEQLIKEDKISLKKAFSELEEIESRMKNLRKYDEINA